MGDRGGLPWRIPSDLARFRELTLGKPVIMGRKTWESIGRPLPGRDNIVITRNSDWTTKDLLLATSVEAAVTLARRCACVRGVEEIAVIGGAEIYRALLPDAGRIHLSRVHATPEGDTVFPVLDEGAWREVAREPRRQGKGDSAAFTLITLERIRADRESGQA